MASSCNDEELVRLRHQLEKRDNELQQLAAQLRDKDSVISELNSTVELLRLGLGQLHRPRLRGIGISAEPPPAASCADADAKLVCHDKPQRFRSLVVRCLPTSSLMLNVTLTMMVFSFLLRIFIHQKKRDSFFNIVLKSHGRRLIDSLCCASV